MPAEAGARLGDLAEELAEPRRRDPEVDEPGACSLRTLDLGQSHGGLRQLGGELARRPAALWRQAERHVRGVVPMLRVVRALQLHGHAGKARERRLETRD
jgi:hypothetical protein